MKSLTRFLILALLAALPSGCGNKSESKGSFSRPKFIPKVTAREVLVKNVVYSFEAVGTLEAVEHVEIPARVSGVVDRIRFVEGDQVTPESVLAEIDIERFQLEARRAKAALSQAEIDLKNAQNTYQRRMALRRENKGWVTEEELETHETALEKAIAFREQMLAQYKLARKNLKDARIRPPIDGFIDRKDIDTGEYVAAGATVATLRNLSSLNLTFHVPETESGRIRIGQDVMFQVTPFPEKTYAAQIFFISSSADPVTRLVECKARIEKPDTALKPGFFATLEIQTENHADAVVIPEEAIRPSEKGFTVYVLQEGPDGMQARSRIVALGLRSGPEVEILSGLSRGETIAVLGSDALHDGARVEIVTEEN